MKSVRKSSRILLVDDDLIVAETVKDSAPDSAYIQIETDSTKVLNRLLTESYDLIVLDQSMPRKSGEGLAFDIKALFPHQKIMIFTALPYELNFPESFGIRVLEKPFNPSQIFFCALECAVNVCPHVMKGKFRDRDNVGNCDIFNKT